MRNGNATKQNKQKGFTLIELVIAVVVIGLAVSFAAPVLRGLVGDTTYENEVNAIERTIAKMQKRYSTDPWGATLDNDMVLSGKLEAEAYKTIKTSGTIYNAFGGEVIITGVDFNGLIWEEQLVPANSCSAFVQAVGARSYFEEVTIGATTLQFSATNPDDYATTCDAQLGTDDSVTIVFTKEEA
jgi:prepilin-type N-terminal cleavage/methylation domain-containing protein